MKKYLLIAGFIVASALHAETFGPEFLETLKTLQADAAEPPAAKALPGESNAKGMTAAEESPFEVQVMNDPKAKIQNGVIYMRRVPFRTVADDK